MATTTWALAALTLGAGAAGATELSILDRVDGQALYWGLDNTAVYGQTLAFDAPIELRSFEVQLDDGGTPIAFTLSVQEWGEDGPAGPVLFEGAGTTSGEAGLRGTVADLGGLPLGPGRYVVLLQATSDGAAAFGTAENSYPDGAWVYLGEGWYVSETSDLGFRLEY
jgi:hypothetical protein